MRTFLLASSAIATLATALPAMAQDAKGETGGIGEIVVTAQKKEESLQDAAIAIDAVTGSSLIQAGVSQARDITKLVPALTIGNGGGVNASLFMRGVGNRTNNSYNDSAIAVSYDGVYVSRAAAVNGAAFYDLERVEVLKGPQGILYGRNATGGALNVIPAKPKLGDFAVGLTGSYGSYNAFNAQAYVNAPLGDSAALRLSFTRQSQDGINLDGSDDRDVTGLRAQVLFQPNDDWSVRVGFDYTKLGGRGPGGHYLGNFTPGPGGYTFTAAPLGQFDGFGTAAANAYRTTQLGAPGFGFLSALNTPIYIDNAFWGVNAEINHPGLPQGFGLDRLQRPGVQHRGKLQRQQPVQPGSASCRFGGHGRLPGRRVLP